MRRAGPRRLRGEILASDVDLRDSRQLCEKAGGPGATARAPVRARCRRGGGRRARRESRQFFEEGRWAGMWSSAVPPWVDLPEERLHSSQLRTALLEAIDALPRMQRAVITLRDVEGWPPDEVCEYLGVADGNQRVLLHRARAAARAAIERYLEEGTE